MSCRSTHAGTLALRLARAQTGLSDKSVQSLFHALKREGKELSEPNSEDLDMLRLKYRSFIDEAPLTDVMRDRSERDLLLLRDEQLDGSTFYALERIEARVRQEQVIRSVKAMVADLEEPGSQADQYELGPDGRPTKVWYASYGSNLSRNRFLTYIQGGTPEGSSTNHDPARDTTLPEEDMPIRFEGRMHFASSSGRWGGGGIAFMDEQSTGHALGRAYLVTMEQFDDVVAQENGKSVGTVTVDLKDALGAEPKEVMTGLYGTVAHIGDYKGAPVLTFTGSFSAAEAVQNAEDAKTFFKATNPPSGNYLRMIGSGLSETFGMSIEEQADYLRGSAGAEKMTRADIVNILSTPPEELPKPAKKYKSSGSSYYGGLNPAWRDSYWERPSSSSRRSYKAWWEDGAGEDDSDRLDDWGYSGSSSRDSRSDTLFDLDDWGGNPMALSDIIGTDEDFSEKEWEDMLARDEAKYSRGAWGKRCAMCGDLTHTMHDCPIINN